MAESLNFFDNAPCGYHAIDDRGYFTEINKTLLQWLGYEKNEVLGKLRFADIFAEKEFARFDKQFLQAHEMDLSWKGEFDLIRKNGSVLSVVISIVARRNAGEKSEDRFYATTDNSKCKQALDRIKTLDQELEAFTYSVSHDLRAPLRSIDGYSRILQEDFGASLDDEGKRVLNVIMSNAKRMGKLIDDLLDFTRLGRKEIQSSKVNMTMLVNSVIQEILRQQPDRQIDVKVTELHTVFADVEMMRQVWVNLIENAVKYTGKTTAPAIEISSHKTAYGDVCYVVKDNGVGFDMKYAPKLFGVFQRLHKIQDFSGTGVGLAIVKRIISRHEGRVWAESTLQKGATFYFTIPNNHES